MEAARQQKGSVAETDVPVFNAVLTEEELF